MFQPNAAHWQHQEQQQQNENANANFSHSLNVSADQQENSQPINNYNQNVNSGYINNYGKYQRTLPNSTQQSTNNIGYFQENHNKCEQQQQTLTQNFFDNNQNSTGKNDGWGDWGDWNDNNMNAINNHQSLQQQQQQQPQTFFNLPSQQTQNTTNVISDSFNASDNNWNWNLNMNSEQTTTIASASPSSAILPPPPAMQAQQQHVTNNMNNIQQPPAQLLDGTAQSLSPSPATNNIPNSVYVTQAKPVTMPSRQYASTPNEGGEAVYAPPPEAFQNETSKMLPSATMTMPPPPPSIATGAGNPFKRSGNNSHYVTNFIPTTVNKTAVITPILLQVSNDANNTIFDPPPPPPPVNYEHPDNSEVLHENEEVIAQSSHILIPQQQPHLNDERNQYLQTSHLSENAVDDNNIEADSLPPPGLSRLVLGQPELNANQRLVTGTEDTLPDLVGEMSLNERHADGEDNANDGSVMTASSTVTNMQITADRNLYLVPGQSNGNNDQLPRVITGFDNAVQIDTPINQVAVATGPPPPQQQQREIELDGENIEDQQQLQKIQQHRNEPPVEGAAAHIEQTKITTNLSTEAKESSTQVIVTKEEIDVVQHKKQLSNSRKQLEKDHHTHSHHGNDKKHSSVDRFSDDESEDADYSSDRERNRNRRNYREGSVRSEVNREREDSDMYQKERRRRDRRDRDSGDNDKPREKYRNSDNGIERRSKRYTRYEHDSSLDESSRKEKPQSRRGTRDNRERERRSDREYDEFNRRYRNSKRVIERDEDIRPRRERDRDRDRERGRECDRDYDENLERRRRRDKHGTNRTADIERDEYEEYRKQSSRNARESDIEKDRNSRPYDPRYAAMYGYPHGTQNTSGYGAYDPYAYYYEHMARFNPQAYTEMYKKYYGANSTMSGAEVSGVGGAITTTPAGAGSDHLTGDGRESVHSGRSSLPQEQER